MHKLKYLMCGTGMDPKRRARTAKKALVLCEGELSAADKKITALLDFFGIPWSPTRITDLAVLHEGNADQDYCVLSSAPCMVAVLGGLRNLGTTTEMPPELLAATSVYVYGFQETLECRSLLRFLTNTEHADIRKPNTTGIRYVVSTEHPELCGPMAGLQVSVKRKESDVFFEISSELAAQQSLLSVPGGSLFVTLERCGQRFFLNAAPAIIDLTAPVPRHFDVKEHFSDAVPSVLYLKWACREVCWNGSDEVRGCLIVDDPLLKPRYGFLEFSEVLELMDQHNFTTSIAFIPWNWQRSNRKTVQQFRSRADRLSLCVHGCDHSSGEFAAKSDALLNRRTRTAKQRMASFDQRTALQHEEIMVFPQGLFSPDSGRALKLNGFVAASNTEVAPAPSFPNNTTIADTWDVAIMRYGSFPIFTRRYLEHGVENFAFDALLGKPCLMVAHHEVFKNHGRELVEFIGKLNSLNWDLRWTSLADAIRHSYKQKGKSSQIRMYANELILENMSGEPREFHIIKDECDPDCVKAVEVNGKVQEYTHHGQQKFRVMIAPSQAAKIRVVYLDQPGSANGPDPFSYRVKIGIRRHLSEFRDNHVARSTILTAITSRLLSQRN